MKRFLFLLGVLLSISMLNATSTLAATKTSTGTGLWSAAIWTPSAPASGDDIVIATGHTVTLDVTPAFSIATLTINTGNTPNGLTISGTNSLTATGAVTMNVPTDGTSARTLAVGAGTLSCASITMGNVGAGNDDIILSISTGTVTVSGNVTMSGSSSENFINLTGAGTLNLGGSSGGGSLSPGTSSTVNYSQGGNQTIKTATYNNLTLSGSGIKDIANDITVNGKLSLQGTATFDNGGNTLTYGSSATLEYKTTNSRNIGNEWVLTPFTPTGGIIVDNPSGTLTINAARAIANASALNLTNGVLAAGTNLTMTTTSSISRSEGSMTGTLQGTGRYNVTYTGNSKTTGVELAISGTTAQGLNDLTVNLAAGQTLTLDVSRTPDGNLTVSSGIFDLNALTINRSAGGGTFSLAAGTTLLVGGASNYPGSYTANTLNATSTVNYDNAGDQAVSGQTYGNLTLSGSGAKTTTGVTVNGKLSMQGSATASAATAGTATLEYKGSQATTGAEFPASMANNVIIDNAPNSISLSATKTLGASATLTLTSGTVTTGANEISITNSAAAAVVATAGIIDGQITRAMANNASTYIFNDASCTITRVSGTNPTSVTMKSFPNSTVPYGTTSLAARRYYTIAATGGSGSWDLTLSYRNAGTDERNSLNQSLFSLWRGDGAVWVDQLGSQSTATNPPNSGKVTSNGVTSFLDWTFAETDGALPIQLASFNGSAQQNGNVALTWVTLSEVNNYGFYVQRKRPSEQEYFEIPASFVAGHGTTNEPQTYTFTDVAPGSGTWMYRLKQVDLNGAMHYAEPIQIDVLTGVGENGTMPAVYELNQNYPNPFNPSTMIAYAIPQSGHVTLKVYNLLGAEVATLLNGDMPAGYHYANWNASGMASGVYIYQLTAGKFVETKKLTLMK